MIDAEHQHFQPAIDYLALQLMKQYNVGGRAVIYNTYQAGAESLLAAARAEGLLGAQPYQTWHLAVTCCSLVHLAAAWRALQPSAGLVPVALRGYCMHG